MLSIVDIIGEKNTTIILDWTDSEILKNVFSCEINNNLADLKNRLSRKKQTAPELSKYFQN
jgi:inorganic pyrophosphatase/exopolyphosphatase